MTEIDLVVTDLDGTLWDARERIHDRTLQALRTLEERKLPLLVATGRRPRSAAAGLAREGLAPPAVLLDGAVGRDLATHCEFHRAAFPPADAAAALERLEADGLSPCAYVAEPDADVFVGLRPSTSARHLEVIGDGLRRGDLREIAAAGRVLAFGITGLPAARFAAVAAAVSEVAEASVTRDLYFGGATLMVKPPGVSKWRGVEAFCAAQDIDPARVLALGDGENDLELLTGARVACVVSDGCAEALALADHIIEPAHAGGWCAVLDLC